MESYGQFHWCHTKIFMTYCPSLLCELLWFYDMEMLSASLVIYMGNQPITGGFSSQRASNVELWCYFWCKPEKLFIKQLGCWWFGRPWHSCDVTVDYPWKVSFTHTILKYWYTGHRHCVGNAQDQKWVGGRSLSKIPSIFHQGHLPFWNIIF